ncbi:LuxR family transcriptional regulator [Iodidimonas muriae]|uniref:LuxR family transcriptional regulator n=2 Tax=Iodidimonas muriae TaxID=261467 RepID=A0ABQ2LAK3_9PROT|nr:LuxR family transcriptional regulator [Iodidimonas muriae]
MLAEPTQRFLSDLPGARNLQEASMLLGDYSQSLPVPRAAFDNDLANPSHVAGQKREPIGVELGWPSDFVRRWFSSGLMLACPLVVPCRKMRRPFSWGLDEDNLGLEGDTLPKPFTALGQQTLSLLRQVGVRSGITVPVHQPGGRTGFVTWVSNEPLKTVRDWADRHAGELFLVGHAFLEHVDMMVAEGASDMADACSLTERERECLTWVACGKTDSEIGIIIDRSPETARFHVRNAIAKLDASSRSHAVAKAMRKGWLGQIE